MRATFSRHNVFLLALVVGAAGVLQLPVGSTIRAVYTVSTAPQSPVAVAKGSAVPGSRRAPRVLAAAEARELFAAAKRTADESKAGELFASRSWYTPPPPAPPPPPEPVAAPTAPPLPYKFVGAYTDGASPTVYFITRDDRVYDVRPGDAVDQDYSVDSIEDGQLVFTYKPLNTRQLLPMGGGT